MNATAILPTGKRLNPHNPAKAEFADNFTDPTYGGGHVVNVKDREGNPSYRIITGFSSDWAIGEFKRLDHDQHPGRSLTPNSYRGAEIVGTITPGGTFVGLVPNKAMPHWVFK